MIGLRGLTYDQLKDAGIDVSKISQVRYQGSEMSEESKGLKDQCWESILILCDKDIPKAKAKLKELTGFKGKDSKMVPGKDNIEWLTELQIKILHGKLKDLMPKKAEEAKKEEKGAVGGSQEEKRGKSDESHVKFIDSMHGLLKKVGKEAYFKVLGDHGFTSETGIFDRKDQIKVYEALSKLAEVKNA